MYTEVHCASVLTSFADAGRVRDTKPSGSPDRTIFIGIPDLDRTYYATLVGRHLEDVSDQPPSGPAQITLTLDSATLVELFSGKLSPFVALSSRRVKLEASVRDMPRLRALFFGAGT